MTTIIFMVEAKDVDAQYRHVTASEPLVTLLKLSGWRTKMERYAHIRTRRETLAETCVDRSALAVTAKYSLVSGEGRKNVIRKTD